MIHLAQYGTYIDFRPYKDTFLSLNIDAALSRSLSTSLCQHSVATGLKLNSILSYSSHFFIFASAFIGPETLLF